LTTLCQFVPWSIANITAQLLQDKVRPTHRHKQPELLECGVILLQDIATPYHHHDVQNLVQCWGHEVLAHPPYTPDLVLCD
jgi:hypothetical protein